MTQTFSVDMYRRAASQIKGSNKRVRNAVKTEVDGIKFDSKLEAGYYQVLKDRRDNKEILGFEMQRTFKFRSGVSYKADFLVWTLDGTAEVHEAKGYETETWKIKEKMFVDEFPWIPLKVIKK